MSPTEFDFTGWQAKFLRQLGAFPHARASWERLLGAGCDSTGLVVGLALACDFEGAPAYSILEEIRTSARQRASELRRATVRLERDLNVKDGKGTGNYFREIKVK